MGGMWAWGQDLQEDIARLKRAGQGGAGEHAAPGHRQLRNRSGPVALQSGDGEEVLRVEDPDGAYGWVMCCEAAAASKKFHLKGRPITVTLVHNDPDRGPIHGPRQPPRKKGIKRI